MGDPTDPADRWGFSHEPGDPESLPSVYPPGIYPYDSGIWCEGSGGATCPIGIGAQVSTGINHPYDLSDGLYLDSGFPQFWQDGVTPELPIGGRLSFISTYRIPPYDAETTNGTCADIPADTELTLRTTSRVNASTDPLANDLSSGNDRARVSWPLAITACSESLAVETTVASPETDGDPETDLIGVDRKVTYRMVATNTSDVPLALPRMRVTMDPLPTSGTVTCTDTTGGAQCPDFDPEFGTQYLADGSTKPLTGNTAYDFLWGENGAPTMPAGSTATFEFAMQYPQEGPAPSPTIQAIFTGDASNVVGRWETVSDGAYLTVPSGPALGLSKTVSPSQPNAGEKVTFTVDLLNPTGRIQAIPTSPISPTRCFRKQTRMDSLTSHADP